MWITYNYNCYYNLFIFIIYKSKGHRPRKEGSSHSAQPSDFLGTSGKYLRHKWEFNHLGAYLRATDYGSGGCLHQLNKSWIASRSFAMITHRPLFPSSRAHQVGVAIQVDTWYIS